MALLILRAPPGGRQNSELQFSLICRQAILGLEARAGDWLFREQEVILQSHSGETLRCQSFFRKAGWKLIHAWQRKIYVNRDRS